MMARKKHSPEQIVAILLQIEVAIVPKLSRSLLVGSLPPDNG